MKAKVILLVMEKFYKKNILLSFFALVIFIYLHRINGKLS